MIRDSPKSCSSSSSPSSSVLILANRAFTRLELAIVVAVLAVLAALLIPAIAKWRKPALRITCTSHLKIAGLAFRIWSSDHMNLYPMQVLANRDGSLLFANATNTYRYFAAMSNELNTPTVLFLSG